MRKLFFLIVFVLLGTSAAFSQLLYGLKGGLNLADFSDMQGQSDMKASFYAGGFFEYRKATAAVAPELYYSRQGFQYEEYDAKMRVRVNYLNLPVVIKLYVLKGVSLDLGPQLGYMLNSKVWAKSGSQTVTEDFEEVFPNVKLNTLDFSFVMGLTCNVENFFLQGRYTLGITDVVESEHLYPNDEVNNKNRVFQFGIGCRF